jgi:hypothetical protein
MSSIHESEYCSSLRQRVDKLTPDAKGQWGTMSVEQMLWHLNASMSLGLGKLRAAAVKPPLPPFILKPMFMYLPIPKGKVEALPETIAPGRQDFNVERARFHSLIEEFSLKPLHFNWLDHPMLGRLSGPEWSKAMAKHNDYHLKQFGV